MAETKKESSGKGVIIVIFLLICLVGYCNRDKESTNTNTTTTSDKNEILASDEMEKAAVAFSQEFVKGELKAPSTAKFPEYDEENSHEYTGNLQDSIFIVKSYVDAQNEYGAMLRKKYVVNMKFRGGDRNDGHNWELISVDWP